MQGLRGLQSAQIIYLHLLSSPFYCFSQYCIFSHFDLRALLLEKISKQALWKTLIKENQLQLIIRAFHPWNI